MRDGRRVPALGLPRGSTHGWWRKAGLRRLPEDGRGIDRLAALGNEGVAGDEGCAGLFE
jgi:hypothetical protein